MPYYFNAASYGLPAAKTYKAMAEYLQSEAELGPDQALADWADKLSSARKAAASLISASVDQIGITSTTTAAWYGLISTLNLAGKRVLVTEHEWGDYYRALAARSDVEIQVLPSLDFDTLDVSSWADCIDEDVAAIFVPMVTSIAGLRYPVEAIGSLARPEGTKLIVDAAQAIGQIGIDVTSLQCDAIFTTCRKWLRGPRQTAMFWLRENWQSGGVSVDAKTLAPADQNPALLIGLGAALENHTQLPQKDLEQQLTLQGNVIRRWAENNAIRVFGGNSRQSPIVSLEFDQETLTSIQQAFGENDIIAKTIDIAKAEPLNPNGADLKKVLRITPHIYTTEADYQHLFSVLSSVVN